MNCDWSDQPQISLEEPCNKKCVINTLMNRINLFEKKLENKVFVRK